MPALTTPICNFGWKAIDFELLGIDEINHSFSEIKGQNGSLVMFICNHCPYVKSVIHRIVEDCKVLQDNGIGIIAVMSNDVNDPKYGHEDSFDNMKLFASNNKLVARCISISFSSCFRATFAALVAARSHEFNDLSPSSFTSSAAFSHAANSTFASCCMFFDFCWHAYQ